MRAGLHASCDEDARPRLPFWKWPVTGRGKTGSVGRGNGERVRETEKHVRSEIWVEKKRYRNTYKNTVQTRRVNKYHGFSTTFSPPYHRTRRRTGPPTTSTARNRHLARQKCAPRRLSFNRNPRSIGIFSARAYPGPKAELLLAVIAPARSSRDALALALARVFAPAHKKTKKVDPEITRISLWGCAGVIDSSR